MNSAATTGGDGSAIWSVHRGGERGHEKSKGEGVVERIGAMALVFLREREHLYPLFHSIRGRRNHQGAFCERGTDLCIEGFESSANTYVYNYFRLLRPDLTIAHHKHAVANVKRALRYGVPTCILFRNPADAIPSLVVRFRRKLYEAVLLYIHFYRYIHGVAGRVLLASFEEVTGCTERTVKRVEGRSGLAFGAFNPASVEEGVREHIRTWTKEHKDVRNVALPTEERESRKRRIQEELMRHPLFPRARSVYETTCRLYEQQTGVAA